SINNQKEERSVIARRTLKMRHRVFILLVLFILVPSSLLLMTRFSASDAGPEIVLEQFLKAVYARDYRTAYQWISAKDRKHKSETDYLRENSSFSGVPLELTRKLADMIEFRDFRSEIREYGATVRFTVKMPNANATSLRDLFLDFDPERLVHLSKGAQQVLIDRLEDLRRKGNLPALEGEESWDLVKEPAGWRVFLNWAGAIQVLFQAEVKDGLPWKFWPVQDVVLAKPGETLQAVYRAKNLSDKPVTAKAIHIDEPKDLAEKYLETIQCFCFIQTTLEPGEEGEFLLSFRVNWDVPDSVKEFRVTYEFYPIDKLPEK
ncbi:MAG: cytochrome c oxidase assembly protein, partial [Candidatus Binatia bacterium]